MSAVEHIPIALRSFALLIDGGTLALAVLISYHMWMIRRRVDPKLFYYMARMCIFLIVLAIWWLASRAFILHITGTNYTWLDVGRLVMVSFQFWAEIGLVRFLGREHHGEGRQLDEG